MPKKKKAPKSSTSLTPAQEKADLGCNPESISEVTTQAGDNVIYTDLLRAATGSKLELNLQKFSSPHFGVQGTPTLERFHGVWG